MASTNSAFEVLDEQLLLSTMELARACDADEEWVRELAAQGVIAPVGREATYYSALTVVRLRKARRLERDFDLNASGLALVLELLDEIERLRSVTRGGSSGLGEHQ